MRLFKNLKIFVFIILILFIVFFSYVFIDGYNLYKDAISKTPLEEKISYMQNKSDFVKLNDISSDFADALIAIEDHRFYDHGAIDIISIGRAIISDIKQLKLAEGGSTISQQLAKNLYFTQEKKFTRKIAEIFVAYNLENYCNKDEILELYINSLYFGDGYYGIFDAAKGYFNKAPKDLNYYESTLLAGIPNAPSVYALSNNSTLSYERQNQVIEAMIKHGFITEEEAKNKLN